MTTGPVVVAVKETQPAALAFGAEAAKARGVALRVVHCVVPLTEEHDPTVDDILWLGAGQQVLDVANETIGRIAPELTAEFVLEPGAPGQGLLAEAGNACMVVVGTDAKEWTERLHGGHVAEHLAKHSPVPLAIVPERSLSQTRTGAIVVAIDAHTPARGPLGFAFREASRSTNELHVVHVAPPGVMYGETTALRAQIAEILAGWTEQYPDVEVTRELLFDEPGEGSLRAGRTAEVLVLGRHRKSKIRGPFGHPVLTQIARKAICPCVVVPDEWSDGAL